MLKVTFYICFYLGPPLALQTSQSLAIFVPYMASNISYITYSYSKIRPTVR